MNKSNYSPFWLVFTLVGIVWVYFTAVIIFGGPVTKYEGRVVSVSSWDGSAWLKTKSKYNGKDTTVYVSALKYERFAVGQLITVWTGGEKFNKFTTEAPE